MKKENKLARGKLFLLGILLGLVAGATFGILIIGMELTKEQMVKQAVIKSCLETMGELEDMCIEKIHSAQTLCLFSNDLHFEEIVGTSQLKVE